jgi:hypothetical protein
MLHQPELHEPLTAEPWRERRIRDGIRAIVADADEAFRGPRLFWQAHEWDRWRSTSPMKNLYVGSAGVIWALHALRRRGHAETGLDLVELSARNLELRREKPDFFKGEPLPEPRESSLLEGETGLLVVAWRLAPDASLADTLLERIRANVANPADEVMWGSPGTLLAARAMLEWTCESRWRGAWQESAEALLERRDAERLWVQRLYGLEIRSLMPLHGLVGIVAALVPLLDPARAAALERDTAAILARAAVLENGLANWPGRMRRELAEPDGLIKLQWCQGAPGVVAGAAEYLDEELMLAGAELVWRAGPCSLDKGSSICHGTAGNGYALLKTFARTGDERWLERARRFAVHALGQVERARAARGRGRYSLWTGDVGAALFAADCIDSRSAYPLLDSFDW